MTPDSSGADLPGEISNTGKIVVKKRIAKIEKGDSIQIYDKDSNRLVNGKMMQRKKKGRLYSLGGNEPPKRAHRGRLDRLKTVGTFDWGNDESGSSELPRSLIEEIDSEVAASQVRRSSATALVTPNVSGSLEFHQMQQHRPSHTPGPCRREINKANFGLKKGVKYSSTPSATSTPGGRRTSNLQHASGSSHGAVPNVPTQHSADDCVEKPRTLIDHRKSKSCSSSNILTKYDMEMKNLCTAQIHTHNMSSNSCSSSSGKSAHNRQTTTTTTPTATTSFVKKTKTGTNTVNFNVEDSNRIETLGGHATLRGTINRMVDAEIRQKTDAAATASASATQDLRKLDKDSDKIEKDEASAEDTNKTDDANAEVEPEFVYKPRKPVLRKSKRIVRTDSELFDETHMASSTEIVLEPTKHIQIHNEPDYMNETAPVTRADSCKESSDLDDICSPREPLKSTTDDSSRNMSTEEVDTVFSDSTTDLEQLEREYRELARSNLQREYKSDGDTLDEVGKKRNDFQKWKNQSFETNFELYGQAAVATNSSTQSTGCIEDADRIEVLERGVSIDHIDQSDDIEIDFDMEIARGIGFSGVCSPSSHITCSTTNSSEASSTRRTDEAKYFFSRIGDVTKEAQSKSNSPRESDTSSPLRVPAAMPDPPTHQPQPPRQSPIVAAAPLSPCLRPSKLEIHQNVANTPKENSLVSLFEKRFGTFKKINKLIKTKRSSASALYDKRQMEEKQSKITRSTDTEAIPTAAPITATETKCGSTSRLFRSAFSPGKSSRSESKNSIYSSKLSLFSSKTAKSSIFHKKSMMFSNSSRSHNELNMRTGSKTTLTEISKSNSEINKYKFSPSRFSMKRSMKEKKPNSATSLYKQPVHSPLSEEFYNKTGSVRLSAMELYEKFCSEDFGGLYKHELNSRGNGEGDTLCGGYRNWHEYRLEHRGLGAVKKYARGKMRLLKQKSEPKFTFRGDAATGDYDPREEDEDFYEEQDYFEQDEYVDEDEFELEEGECEDEYDGEGEGEGEEMTDEESEVNDEYEPRAYHSDNDEVCGMATTMDSDVDEIYLMPEGGKCSDYEQYGFENKHFTMEHSLTARVGGIDHDLNIIEEIPYCDDVQSQFEYVSEQVPECYGSDEVLTIYKFCSKDDLLPVNEDEEPDDSVRLPSQSVSTTSDATEPGCSSIENALNEYVKNAPPDISVNIESGDLKTDERTVIERAESIELLSNSSGTIRSGSTLTGYDFDTVKNLNLDSCSTSKLSLSLKSDGYDDFTLTPDEPRRMKKCDVEDFTLTPDASVSEAPADGISPADDADTEQNVGDVAHDNSIFEQESKNEDGSISSTEVLVIVDKFLTNERLLQHNLNIVPVPTLKMTSTTLVSPVDSDASLSNVLLRQKSGTMFNNLSSSSKSTIDDEIEKFNFDDELDAIDPTKNDGVSTFTSEITKEFDLLFTRAQQDIDDTIAERVEQENADSGEEIRLTESDETIKSKELTSPHCNIANELTPPPRIPTRYSMQKLEPYFFSDDIITSAKENSHSNNYIKNNVDSIVATAAAGIAEPHKADYCKVLDVNDNGSFLQKKIISKLKKNRSQSLGNLNKKTRCFPL